MLPLRLCIDVPDLDDGIEFYTRAFDLKVSRRLGPHWAELRGASSLIDLVTKAAGSSPLPGGHAVRSYERHWTPVHLDVVVTDLEHAVRRAEAEGATLERPIQEQPWGRLANLADPFGHGLCLLQFNARGYDALLNP